MNHGRPAARRFERTRVRCYKTARMKLLLLSLPLVCLLATAAQAEPKRLNLFIWSEYLDPALVTKFEREHHCRVVIDLYEDPESMLAKLQAGGSQYDLVVPTDYLVPGMIRRGLLAPLRHERIPNLTNLAPRFVSPPYDSGNRYTAAYQWGTLGILARPPAGQKLPETWGCHLRSQTRAGTNPADGLDA